MVGWSGWGSLTILILTGGFLLGTALAEGIRALGYQEEALLGLVPGFLAAAYVNTALARWLDRRSVRRWVDRDTGETMEQRWTHCLFLIPIGSWSVMMVLVALLFLFPFLFRSIPITGLPIENVPIPTVPSVPTD